MTYFKKTNYIVLPKSKRVRFQFDSIVVLAVVAFILSMFTVVPVSIAEDVCQIAKSAIVEASELRGLSVKRSVPCRVHSKEQVRKYLKDTIEQKIPRIKLESEELLYKAFGYIPEDYNYVQGLIEIYLAQIGGYYDPEKKHYVMAGWMPDTMQNTIAVHELTHALQDQHFNLEKMLDVENLNSDELFSRSAIVEGDATLVMMDYERRRQGLPPLSGETNVDSAIMNSLMSASMMAGSSAPQSLVSMIIFPYTSGLRFAHEILKKDGYRGLSNALKRLPRSTEEILHSELFYKRTPDFKEVTERELKDALSEQEWSLVYSDRFGEFSLISLFQMLGKTGSEVVEAAKGWGGDRIALFGKDTSDEKLIYWRILWDSEADAREFKTLYEQSLKKEGRSQPMDKGWMILSKKRKLKIDFSGRQIDLSVLWNPVH